jgi:TetR/AcrR family transcriptional repressor of nem operon
MLAADGSRGCGTDGPSSTNQVGVYIEMMVRLLPAGFIGPPRASAIAALSTLVGAVSMARAADDEVLSREILASAGTELKAQLG